MLVTVSTKVGAIHILCHFMSCSNFSCVYNRFFVVAFSGFYLCVCVCVFFCVVFIGQNFLFLKFIVLV